MPRGHSPRFLLKASSLSIELERWDVPSQRQASKSQRGNPEMTGSVVCVEESLKQHQNPMNVVIDRDLNIHTSLQLLLGARSMVSRIGTCFGKTPVAANSSIVPMALLLGRKVRGSVLIIVRCYILFNLSLEQCCCDLSLRGPSMLSSTDTTCLCNFTRSSRIRTAVEGWKPLLLTSQRVSANFETADMSTR